MEMMLQNENKKKIYNGYICMYVYIYVFIYKINNNANHYKIVVVVIFYSTNDTEIQGFKPSH